MRFLGETFLRNRFDIAAVVTLSSWGLKPSYPALIGSALCATAIFIAGSWLALFNETEREPLLEVAGDRRAALSKISVALLPIKRSSEIIATM